MTRSSILNNETGGAIGNNNNNNVPTNNLEISLNKTLVELNRKAFNVYMWDQTRLKTLNGPLFKPDRKVVEGFFECYASTCFIFV